MKLDLEMVFFSFCKIFLAVSKMMSKIIPKRVTGMKTILLVKSPQMTRWRILNLMMRIMMIMRKMRIMRIKKIMIMRIKKMMIMRIMCLKKIMKVIAKNKKIMRIMSSKKARRKTAKNKMMILSSEKTMMVISKSLKWTRKT